MSIRDLCQMYHSSASTGKWKKTLGEIIVALEGENHPDQQHFRTAAYMLMMNDKPGYWSWLETAIVKLIDDPTARLDSLPDLLDYDELSSNDLVEKYERNDKNYSRHEIFNELKQRHPLLIHSDQNLKEQLKDVL